MLDLGAPGNTARPRLGIHLSLESRSGGRPLRLGRVALPALAVAPLTWSAFRLTARACAAFLLPLLPLLLPLPALTFALLPFPTLAFGLQLVARPAARLHVLP